MPEAKVTWIGGKQFLAESGSGHGIVLDTPPGIGGRNTGPTPMELVLMGLGGCTGVDIAFILGDRMKQEITGIEVAVSGKQADEPPKVYTDIDVSYRVKGKDLSTNKALRAIRMSARSYCSISLMLEKTARITSRYEITDETTGERVEGTLGDEQD